MKVELEFLGKRVAIDLRHGIDVSLPVRGDGENPTAWYLDPPRFEPVQMGDFIGSVASGKSSTNFRNYWYNPHAHGTHTECLGHITQEVFSVNQALKTYFFAAKLVTVVPQIQLDGDAVITLEQLQLALGDLPAGIEAVLIRTLPNPESKRTKAYSHTNPPYLDARAAIWLVEQDIQHLLIDLPSVDREEDQGRLAAHKAFWQVEDVQQPGPNARYYATITEMIYVPDTIADGYYLLNLQTAPFENDATPSRPVLYTIESHEY